jgi:hypothetical protein
MSKINPKSLQNLVAGKNKRPNAVRVHARLNPETVKLAKQIGDGEISKGLDKMADLVKAAVSLSADGNHLTYAGRGYQLDADFPRGEIIGEVQHPSSDKYLEVKTQDGKLYRVKHEDVQEI